MTMGSVKGFAGFSALDKPKVFKDDKNPNPVAKYSITLEMDVAEGEKFLAVLEKEAATLIKDRIMREKEAGNTTRLSARPIAINEKAGKMRFSFSRKENEGPPAVVDADGRALTTFVRSGSEVTVAYNLVPYVIGNMVGTRLLLNGVQVIKMAAGSGKSSPKPMTVEEAAKFFGIAAPKNDEGHF